MTNKNKTVLVQLPSELIEKLDEMIKIFNADSFKKKKINRTCLVRDAFIDFIKICEK